MPSACSRRASPPSTASAASTTVRNPASSASASWRRCEGVSVTTVAAWRRIAPASSGPSRVAAWLAMATPAPQAQAMKNSDSEASKAHDASCSTTSRGVMPKLSTCARIMLTKARCCTRTPLGSPVEPDVKIR